MSDLLNWRLSGLIEVFSEAISSSFIFSSPPFGLGILGPKASIGSQELSVAAPHPKVPLDRNLQTIFAEPAFSPVLEFAGLVSIEIGSYLVGFRIGSEKSDCVLGFNSFLDWCGVHWVYIIRIDNVKQAF